MSTVTRFAPSPTGRIHIGNARTALFNWLIARRERGRFLVRVEDTDSARTVPGGAGAVLGDLSWLGLDPAERPWFQSQRRGGHEAALAQLRGAEALYPCFCSEATLKLQRRAQQEAGKPPRYAGTCADLPAAVAARRIADGETHTLRFRVPSGRTVAFTDRVHGPLEFRSDDIGDFVVCRTDGTPAFFFANALDDADAGVTLVLRGEDHLSNTPRQLLLLEALGRPVPEYGHLPLVHDTGGGKLSKRSGALAVSTLREMGHHPLAVANYLARLGGHVDSMEALDLDALAAAFDPHHFARAPAAYDEMQLRYWQRKVLDASPARSLWDWFGAAVEERVPENARDAFIALVRPNVLFPGDALDWAFVMFDDDPAPHKDAIALLQGTDAALFRAALAHYDEGVDWQGMVDAARKASGARGPALFKPLRAALTGRLDGPDLAGVFAMLAPARVRMRLERAMDLAA